MAPDSRHRRRGSRLDAYRADIDRFLANGVWNAVVIFRELQTKGYTGQLSILRDCIRPKRAVRASRFTVRVETPPGHQLQSDWATQRTRIAGAETAGHFIVNTLGFSRRVHFWCTDCEDAEHTYDGLIRAFEWFGGVPAEVLVEQSEGRGPRASTGGRPRPVPSALCRSGRSRWLRPARLLARPRAD